MEASSWTITCLKKLLNFSQVSSMKLDNWLFFQGRILGKDLEEDYSHFSDPKE